jgi:hypothetical protein
MANELQKAFVEDAIPYAEIEEELLELPPNAVGSVFSALNDMLGGNDVWHKHYKSLRTKVRRREKEKDTPQPPVVQGDYVLEKKVGHEIGNIEDGGIGVKVEKDEGE